MLPINGFKLPCHQVTNFLDLPALGRRQPPYMVIASASIATKDSLFMWKRHMDMTMFYLGE